jgi:23S rRNA (guanine745-N1)-methyltransferase
MALAPEWLCPVCGGGLALASEAQRWNCGRGHHFDVAREGYVNLLTATQRRRRQPGDTPAMVRARTRFLETGAYDPITAAITEVASANCPVSVLDLGCGGGRHTRQLDAPLVLGIDAAKSAIVAAARSHPRGWYAVASAEHIPLAAAGVETVLSVFGPLVPEEVERIVVPGGHVVAVHPGREHLAQLRALVYGETRPYLVKPPLAHARTFVAKDRRRVQFPCHLQGPDQLLDLFGMTPYSRYASAGVRERISRVSSPITVNVDAHVTVYQRRDPSEKHL